MNAARSKPGIALIGYRGCGKSAVAAALAELRGCTWVDTDELIVARAGRSIAEIFKAEGEPRFRVCEAEVIADIAQQPPGVIAVGGGAVLDRSNVESLQAGATLVCLTAPAEVLWQRIRDDEASPTQRPALTNSSGLEEVRRVLAERTALYAQAADLVIDTTNLSPQQVEAEIVRQLGL